MFSSKLALQKMQAAEKPITMSVFSSGLRGKFGAELWLS